MTPTLGLFGLNISTCADREGAARIAALAEDLGYDSLWVGDHVVLPDPRDEHSPLEPAARVLDPLIALALLAARTDRISLGTGCIVLPQRNPLILAKQLASLDVLSGGRLAFGLAAGYLEAELNAVGVPLAGRGARTDEYLQAMRSLWYDDKPAFQGQYVHFAGIDAHPRPAQASVPVIVGGHSDRALRRAARYGDGWYGWLLTPEDTAERVAALRAIEAEEGRGPLRVQITPRGPLTPDAVHAYAKAGADRLVIIPPLNAPLPDLAAFVKANAPSHLEATPA
ncbi:TIGR03619 family F420-dependent LLM class oxidoreductase [Actinomadura rupiterrae]|uniref:TIGR03619 family F420-dependent LLM class oxidoreductase n=1 Tax=Actinomadura rupiterrae TaxID=559627 RepID=UPI0020A58F99|nr:TIGR03619 family F420-dependent LLM class oxidoreductase [Actinomadura rupiterrae]MCP2336037.1 putative F420-dependent oxidoreductase [Actinomadura rupiterrae]